MPRRAFDLLAFRGYKSLMEEFYLHGTGALPGDPADGPGWARVHPLTHAEVLALIADGLHMNDWGYACMAKGLGMAIAEAAQRPVVSAKVVPTVHWEYAD